MNAKASAAVSSRLVAVPSAAARLLGPTPCARAIVTNMIVSEPTKATASGARPPSIAGSTNWITTARLIPSPTTASAPRLRPNATTSATNPSKSHWIVDRRSKSVSEYGSIEPPSPPTGVSFFTRRSRSPTSTSGSKPASPVRNTARVPLSGPLSSFTSTRRQRRAAGFWHACIATARTSACSVVGRSELGSRASLLRSGHSSTRPTPVATIRHAARAAKTFPGRESSSGVHGRSGRLRPARPAPR